MSELTLAVVLAITTEALTEYIKLMIGAITRKKYRAVAVCGIALAVSVTLCIMADADIYSAIGVSFSSPLAGQILTGIFASRGANYVSDFLGRISGQKSKE